MDQLAGIFGDAVTRLFCCAKVRADYVLKLEENLTSLRDKSDQLERIRQDVQTSMEDAESMGEMQRTNEVNGWLKRVQNLQKEMEKIQDPPKIRNKYLSGCCPNECVSRYKLGRKVVKMIPKVDELLSKGEGFGKNVDISYKPPFRPIDEMPWVETVGLESMVNKVWSSLEDENVGIIGLYGMGGVGKTTLMKLIHHEFGKREHKFDLVLWVVVARDCDISKVMNDIRHRLGVKDDFWNRSSEDQRAAKIYQVLKQKRFVLMLDDIWEKLELQKVGVPHSKETNYRSKVMLTTRYEDVCDKMQADKKFKVECLREEEAFDLLCKKVGEDTLKCHIAISKLAKKMAKVCGGLPLALITVGSAMAGVKSVEAWKQAKNDLRGSPWTASDLEKNVFCILKFSYDRLPDEAHKNCFLYCALFPEDYAIKVEDLIDRWIGEGFLGKSKKSINDMREEGQSIIEKLRLSCLVEDVMADISQWWPRIKMHDVMRDMALWLACDQDRNRDKVVVEREAFEMYSKNMNEVERISVIRVRGKLQISACPNLLTLCLQNIEGTTDFSNLQTMTNLKVLDLSYNRHIKHLPVEIGKLINLEFLNLSGISTHIRLPIELKNLQKLRVFLMQDTFTSSSDILQVLESLKRLQVLRLGYGWRIGGVSYGETDKKEAILIDKLECLLELEELCINLQTIKGTHKLLSSTKLRGCLRCIWLNFIEEPIEMASLLASWSEMKYLEFVSLQYLYNIKEASSITYTCHLGMLREVDINGCDSITHLTWLRYALLLEVLQVRNCNSMEELVKGGQGEEDVDIDLFSNLRCLELSLLLKLKSIHNRALLLPSLKFIGVVACDNLRKLPLNSSSAKDTLIQITGESEWWSKLEWEDAATKHLLRSKFRPFNQV